MGKTDTDDEADVFVEEMAPLKSGRGIIGLWSRYRLLPRNVFAISLVSLLNDASSEIIYPLLPIFLSLTLGASPGVVGLIEGAALRLQTGVRIVSADTCPVLIEPRSPASAKYLSVAAQRFRWK